MYSARAYNSVNMTAKVLNVPADAFATVSAGPFHRSLDVSGRNARRLFSTRLYRIGNILTRPVRWHERFPVSWLTISIRI